MKKYICEVCDRTEILTEEDAYRNGLDYPPFMGTYGVVSKNVSGLHDGGHGVGSRDDPSQNVCGAYRKTAGSNQTDQGGTG